MDADRWLVRPRHLPDAAWRLYCLPHAGGGTSGYAPWAAHLAPGIELSALCPPVRERHILACPHRDIASLVAELSDVLRPRLRPPYALFGHSFGAFVAYELARALWRRGSGPAHLILSAAAPPLGTGYLPALHDLPEEALLAELDRYGGLPAGLRDEPALLALLLPTLRADLEAAYRYRITAPDPLPCGITVLGGVEDPSVDVDALLRWQAFTTGPFTRRLLPGGHFFPVTHRPEVLHEIRTGLARQERTGPHPHSGDAGPARRTLLRHDMIEEATA